MSICKKAGERLAALDQMMIGREISLSRLMDLLDGNPRSKARRHRLQSTIRVVEKGLERLALTRAEIVSNQR